MSRFSSKNTVLGDSSWIRRADDEDEHIDRDPNYGKSVLSHKRSGESTSPGTIESGSTRTFHPGTSVHALSKRFSTNQDELDSSTPPSGKRSSSTNRSSIGDPNSRTTTTTVTKDGTTETTITTTTKTLRSSVSSPTKTFTERVLSSSKSPEYSPYSTKAQVTERTVSSPKRVEDQLFDTLVSSPTKQDYSPTDSKTVTTTETVSVRSISDKYAEDKLYDSLIPSSLKDDSSPTDRETSVYSTQSVTVRSSTNGGDYKTVTTRTSTSSTPEDELYDTLIPHTIKSPLSIKRREIVEVESSKGLQSPTLSSPSSSRSSISYSSYPDDMSTTTRTTSYTINSKPSYEYSGISSPSSYSSSLYRSRSEELLSDPVYPKSPYRNSIVLEKDLCTHCRKPFNGDAKMILEDMKINCHASCFKCAVCNGSLSHMRAGDSLWVYRKMVHCENCFDITRAKWRR